MEMKARQLRFIKTHAIISPMQISHSIQHYIVLTRLNKPVGILLLLWPTLWALWLASGGDPDRKILAIFIIGVIVMRSAGCIINDIADRHVDKHVKRTRERPITSGKISTQAAFALFCVLLFAAFVLVLFCNVLTIQLAFVGAALAIIYPFLKRFTHLPQVGLGAAFAWGVPMAFAAELDTVPASAWLIYAAAMIWPVMYDTLYAMTDREDDIKVGVKSTAILFAEWDTSMIAFMQLIIVSLMMLVGMQFELGFMYYLSIAAAGLLFLYQFNLIKDRHPEKCFEAFKNNQWVGMIIFVGILLSDVI